MRRPLHRSTVSGYLSASDDPTTTTPYCPSLATWMWMRGGSPVPKGATPPGPAEAPVPFWAMAAAAPPLPPLPASALSAWEAGLEPVPTPACLLLGLPLPATEEVSDWPGASESEEAL